jgi:SAM-dependent methyltransferase
MTETVPPGALHAPHSLRNRDPILAVLRRVLASAHAVLEIGCGPGEQAPFFAAALPHLSWLPADIDDAAVASAAKWREASGVANVLDPLRLDVTEQPWPLPSGFSPDAIVSINMLHIAPFAASEGLFTGAGRILPAGGTVFVYGPFKIEGVHTAPSNAVFDQSLRARDPAWGIRDIEAIIALARSNGLVHRETVAMPANNHGIVFVKES